MHACVKNKQNKLQLHHTAPHTATRERERERDKGGQKGKGKGKGKGGNRKDKKTKKIQILFANLHTLFEPPNVCKSPSKNALRRPFWLQNAI